MGVRRVKRDVRLVWICNDISAGRHKKASTSPVTISPWEDVLSLGGICTTSQCDVIDSWDFISYLTGKFIRLGSLRD